MKIVINLIKPLAVAGVECNRRAFGVLSCVIWTGVTMIIYSFFLRYYAFIMLLLCFSPAANAVIVWYHGVGLATFSNPYSACEARHALDSNVSFTYRAGTSTLQRVHDRRYFCGSGEYYKNEDGTLFLVKEASSFNIVGEGSCVLPRVFNSIIGSCEAPEPDKCSNTVRQVGGATQEDYEVNACVALEQKGPAESCPASFAGNPINFAVGNKFQREVDYPAPGNSTLKFTRSYNSFDGLWRHSFSTRLRIAPDAQSVALVMAHGRESFFTVSGNNVTASSADIGVLTKTATDWRFLSADNERFTFNSAGKLTSWSNASGGSQEFVYNGSQVSVSDHLGNSLTFTEDDKHQPLTLTAPGVQITYGYSSNNRLVAVNKAMGGQTTQRQFHYEDNRNTALLTGITDERGVRYATWSYDDQGRAVSSEHANGAEHIAIEYKSDGSASVTNELGKVANYQFQTILGVKRITAIEGEPSASCPMSNSTFTYDTRGLLKTKIDNKGHLTTYDYNERGLEVSRTEAAGTPQARTVTTDWHPTLFLPLTVTEPSRITHYTYDDQGRQLSQSVTQR